MRTEYSPHLALAAALIQISFAASLGAQSSDPVQWQLQLDPARSTPGAKILGRLEATIERGWHLYSPTTPPGPIPTAIKLEDSPAVASFRLYQPQPNRKFDPNFNIYSETYDEKVTFLLEIELSRTVSPGSLELVAQARYQACSDTICLRPRTKKASAGLHVLAGAATGSPVIPAGYTLITAPARPKPEPGPPPVTVGSQAQSLAQFLLVAFGFGLAAIITPCVFPMIPMTMSFFLNRQPGGRNAGILQALIFCIGIIVLFSGLGLLATTLLGPFGVVQLGSNPWVNAFVAAVFLFFGLSLLGAYEITLPSGLLTRMTVISGRGGYGGALLMGLTFSLTSFACVGPFVGTLLAASVQQGGIQPLLGMASFAAGLASPFFLLALFPSMLHRLPKSGGWLMRVKVVLGFVIIAAMFKYLSNIDQVLHWGLLTRDRFLAVWVVLFALPGLYLLGFLRLEGIEGGEKLGPGRALAGAAFLAFALSLVPGMFGGRLGELDAYVPLAAESGSGETVSTGGLTWLKDDFPGALDRARRQNKLVFVSFTGYACTNCHWMKANMLSRTAVAASLSKYVLVELYTDGTDAASLENQKLQETKFKTVAIPHYAILDAEGQILAGFVGLTKN